MGPTYSYTNYANYLVVAYRTVNVGSTTFERLKSYKVAGKTFDEVLNDLMDRTEPETVHREVLREHERRLRRMKKGESVTHEELRRKLAD